ncbi:MAG TPA: hypothetical protein PLX18_00135 [Anaerohalosphaeraceae bacterium]|nr:hypothetical protein [Anaerohalosphaeraceae bacterium]HQG05081.1 hypothetical protein [Anaerohalosphaeraceae bacterium]HQI06254.1 hypothetical protein [Anaerohalosphaeraceae bacterium]HQJ67126.1 hypothetical protein [Anaerohalosphaeraceae bacterium]
MRKKPLFFLSGAVLAVWFVSAGRVGAVTSVVSRHAKSEDFLKGKLENLMVDSDGNLRLARRADVLLGPETLIGVWTINAVAAEPDGSAVYAGTSPNGTIFKYSQGRTDVLYPTDTVGGAKDVSSALVAPLRNEHVFALAFDSGGRLLAGISGQKARLLRFDKEPTVLFESETDRYIYAITADADGMLYVATGPKGRIYRLPPFGGEAEVVYESRDKNILSLAFAKDGSLLAGSDTRGLVYQIDVKSRTARILYDSQQKEITALTTDSDGNVYLAASSTAAVAGRIDSAAQALAKSPGRPQSALEPSAPEEDEGDEEEGDEGDEEEGGEFLLTAANVVKEERPAAPGAPPAPPVGPAPRAVSSVVRISPDGFVREIFSDRVIFYALLYQDGKVLAATGNQGRLFGIEPVIDHRSILYQNDKSAQITAVFAGADKSLLLGLSNPPQLVCLAPEAAVEGSFTSDLIDAGQPARWGKIQAEGRLPEGSSIRFRARSGNLKDPNDPTFSPWLPFQELTKPSDLGCPTARYLQYQITLVRGKGAQSPLLQEVAVAHSIPNLPPQIQSIEVQPSKDKQKSYLFQIGARALDENGDKLVYHFDFRRQNRKRWISLKKDSEKPVYEWDSRTVEDGRYEIRITADDKRSNHPSEALTASRISETVIVDNSQPAIDEVRLNVQGRALELQFTAADVLSAIAEARYTLDSCEDWIGLLPEDLVFDTTEERFRLRVDNLEPGDHVLTLAVSDSPGNTRYQSMEFTIGQDG